MMPEMCGGASRPETRARWLLLALATALVGQVVSLTGPNVCLVKQKYNITKRIKYRAPTAVRRYGWCLALPPRCSHWTTEMRDLTRLETEERTAEVAACCAGYRIRDVSCVPVCPHGKTGPKCSLDCPVNKWGPNCVHECGPCPGRAPCSPLDGRCRCHPGWQGESCETRVTTTTDPTITKQTVLTSTKTSTSLTTVLVETTIRSTNEDTSSQTTTFHSLANITVDPESTTQTHENTESNDWREVTTNKPYIEVANNSNKTTSSPTTAHEESKYNISSDGYISQTTEIQIVDETMPKNPTKEGQEFITVNNYFTSNITEVNSTTSIVAPSKITVTEPASTTPLISTTREETIATTLPIETSSKPTITTVRIKPKEIWIKPAQKGESPLIETKIKPSFEVPHVRYRNTTQNDPLTGTTPRTIIVSIIPTSMSYSAFKKISLTTAMTAHHRRELLLPPRGPIKPESTSSSTTAPITIRILTALKKKHLPATEHSLTSPSVMYSTSTAPPNASTETSVLPAINSNSMASTLEANNLSLDISQPNPSNTSRVIEDRSSISIESTVTKVLTVETQQNNETTTEKDLKQIVKRNKPPTNIGTESDAPENNDGTTTNPITPELPTNEDSTGATEEPKEESYLLTEPEHITAVLGDGAPLRPSLDLVSVAMIAAGVTLVVITSAAVIVMMDRCRRPRYEDRRKRNDLPLKIVMESDAPPPYVRSIFHTPLPDPPSTEKCHYQPISTLDRNLKQFMRPVVVQNISPLMIENFRGILECHYDHLPQRSNEFRISHSSFSTAPSVQSSCEPFRSHVNSVDEATIEALKADTKHDELDSSTSEPLYAEIPWRPPSEYANETTTINGEAVTEL